MQQPSLYVTYTNYEDNKVENLTENNNNRKMMILINVVFN